MPQSWHPLAQKRSGTNNVCVILQPQQNNNNATILASTCPETFLHVQRLRYLKLQLQICLILHTDPICEPQTLTIKCSACNFITKCDLTRIIPLSYQRNWSTTQQCHNFGIHVPRNVLARTMFALSQITTPNLLVHKTMMPQFLDPRAQKRSCTSNICVISNYNSKLA